MTKPTSEGKIMFKVFSTKTGVYIGDKLNGAAIPHFKSNGYVQKFECSSDRAEQMDEARAFELCRSNNSLAMVRV